VNDKNVQNHLAYQRVDGDLNKPGIVFLSGYASDMTATKATFLLNKCKEENRSYVCFDYRGCGASYGDTSFLQGGIGAWYRDACAVLEHLTNPQQKQILVGSSMGGWIALKLSAMGSLYHSRIHALIGIAAAPDFTEDLMWHGLSKEQQTILTNEGLLPLEENRPPITWHLIEEGRRNLVLDKPLTLDCPLHLLQGKQDNSVPWQGAERILTHVTAPQKQVTWIADGDHRLSRPNDLTLLWETIAAHSN